MKDQIYYSDESPIQSPQSLGTPVQFKIGNE